MVALIAVHSLTHLLPLRSATVKWDGGESIDCIHHSIGGSIF
jgi:hypothetical protein